jgi:hypothetical protein
MTCYNEGTAILHQAVDDALEAEMTPEEIKFDVDIYLESLAEAAEAEREKFLEMMSQVKVLIDQGMPYGEATNKVWEESKP